MSLKNKIFSFLSMLVVILGSAPFSFVRNAYADEGDLPAPATNKQLIDNGDGTYTIALSVTGATESSSTTNVTKANVVLAVDTSNSMNGSSGTAGVSRLEAEKDALTKDDGIIDNLLGQNVPGDPIKSDIIEVGIVNFGTAGYTAQTPTTNATTLKNTINGLTTNTGTNWEEALQHARTMADSYKTNQPDEDVYIIFLTDGEPTTHENDYSVSTAYGTEWGYASDDARGLITAGYKFYALFTWGSTNSAHYLSSLVQYAYTGTGNYNSDLASDYAQYYTNATDTATVIAALSQIVDDITNSVGYTNVEMTDGVTAMTDSSVKTNTNGEVRGLKYYRSGGQYSTTANDGLGEEWTDAPKATINSNGEVDWKLGNLVLENGVTYTVAFVVWPKQVSLDLVADLNNGLVSYNELTSEQKAQIAGSNGSYTLKTNTDYPTVTYSTITKTTVNGETSTVVSTPVTAPITNPDPVDLYSGSLSVEKKWEDGLDPLQQEDFNGAVTLNLYKDGDDDDHIVNTYVLEEANGWKSDTPYAIAPGVMVYSTSKAVQDENYTTIRYDEDGKDYVILEEGHDYHYGEPGITDHYYLTKHIYHPMVVNGVVKNVLFKYDDSGNIAGIEKIESLSTLSATNTLKGGISVFKKVVDKNNNEISELDEAFTVKISFKDANYPYTYRVYYGPNNPCSKDGADEAACNFDPRNHGRTNKITGTGVIESEIYVGDEIMVIDVETGTEFKVEELTDGMKSWYEFSKVEHDISRNSKTNYGSYEASEIDGDYRTVQANSSSRAIVENDYVTGDLEVSKTVEVESGNEAQAKSKEFEFNINVYTDESKTTKLDDYSKTVKLKTGESETISDIPAGTYYEVAETGASGFTTTKTGDTGTVSKNTTSTADFVNTYNVEPKSTQAKVAKMFGDYWDLTRINGFEFQLTPLTTTTGNYPSITASSTTATQLSPASWTFNIVDEGTWTYEITEAEYNHPGVSPLTNNEKVKLTIEAADNGDGTLTVVKTYNKNNADVEETNATIDNTYQTQNTVSETIKVKKTVEDEIGNHNADFTFILSGDDEDEITFNSANQNGGSFKELTFDTAGTYHYTVTEQKGSEGGWTYDESVYNVVIDVTEDYTTATLSSTMTINNVETDTITFSNKYSVKPTSTTVKVTKDFKDYWYEGDSFTFTLESDDGTVKIIKSVDEFNPTATFTLDYDTPGDYNYTITEDTQFTRPGISQVTTEPISVKVSVVDNGDGTMTATVTEGEAETIVNKYDTDPTNAELSVKKTINDLSKSEKDGTFKFDLKETGENGDLIETLTIQTDGLTGEGTFAPIEFMEEGTYEYTITEQDGGVAGFSYDTEPRTVKIVVKDNKLKAELYVASIEIDGVDTDTLEIENDYKAEETDLELSVTKKVDGRDWLDSDAFTFELSGDGLTDAKTGTATKGSETVTFDKINYTEAGTYYYTITEGEDLPASMRNVTGSIDVTVTVEDKNGKLVATAEYSEEDQTIVNEYNPTATEAELKVLKTINDLSKSGADGEFKFDLKDADKELIETLTINTENQSGEGTFGKLNFSEKGTYTYTIAEQKGSAKGFSYDTEARTVEIVVADDAENGKLYIESITIDGEDTNTLEIENEYKAKETSLSLSATKKIDGRDWLDSDAFTFTLSGEGIDEQSIDATKGKQTVEFEEIVFGEVGTYTYTIAETGEPLGGMKDVTGAITVTVFVEDKDGELVAEAEYSVEDQTIVNEYSVKPTSTTVKVTKDFKDYWYEGDSFTFTLESDDGSVKIIKPVDEFNPTATFTLDYDTPGDYNYTITEDTQFTRPGISQVTTEPISVKVSVVDNGDGTMTAAVTEGEAETIENKYTTEPTNVKFNIKKVIEDLSNSRKDATFKFMVNGEEYTVSTSDLEGELDEKIEFSFDKEDTLEFEVSEVNDGQAGFTYDDTVYEVQIKVRDDKKKAQLKATITVNGEKIDGNEYTFEFENKYQAAATEAQISVQKIVNVIDVKNETDEDFQFELADEDGNVIETITITGEGTDSFAPVALKEVGTYKFTVSEIAEEVEGYEFDGTVYEITIEVIDQDGQLAVKSTTIKALDEDAEAVVFTNIYNVPGRGEVPPITPNTGRFTVSVSSTGGAGGSMISEIVTAMIIFVGLLLGFVASRRRHARFASSK